MIGVEKKEGVCFVFILIIYQILRVKINFRKKCNRWHCVLRASKECLSYCAFK